MLSKQRAIFRRYDQHKSTNLASHKSILYKTYSTQESLTLYGKVSTFKAEVQYPFE